MSFPKPGAETMTCEISKGREIESPLIRLILHGGAGVQAGIP
jgi:hypothetical protein